MCNVCSLKTPILSNHTSNNVLTVGAVSHQVVFTFKLTLPPKKFSCLRCVVCSETCSPHFLGLSRFNVSPLSTAITSKRRPRGYYDGRMGMCSRTSMMDAHCVLISRGKRPLFSGTDHPPSLGSTEAFYTLFDASLAGGVGP